jgi:hypothetical protein
METAFSVTLVSADKSKRHYDREDRVSFGFCFHVIVYNVCITVKPEEFEVVGCLCNVVPSHLT